MLSRSVIQQIVPILRKDAKRALRMRSKGFKSPYYCSFLLRDSKTFNTWASSGSTYRRRSDHSRHVYCDLRVGSYRYDQTTSGGLYDNDEELESYNYVNVPIDDRSFDGLRIALWRLSEAKYREAASDFNHKEAARLSTIDPNRRFLSFVPSASRTYIKHQRREKIDEEKWVRFCKRASKWLAALPKVSASWIEFDSNQETKIFVSTENRVIVQHLRVYSLTATIRRLTQHGTHIEQELVINCGSLDELPDMRGFQRLMIEKHRRLLKLIEAVQIHAFSGPVLLYPVPAGLLFHEAIGHRLEGSRLLCPDEGHTFRGQLGKRILRAEISIRDDPKLKAFAGRRCIGAYDYDDEGMPGGSTILVEGGVLRNFLTSRAALTQRGFVPNGHARNAKAQRPISRMSVTAIEGENPSSMEELRAKLIEEIKRQGKPFGMIVYDASGGETETTNYDFQVFSGEIAFATLIYPDGSEAPVVGVNFVGTPLQALGNIVAVGDELELDNGYCGAESGLIPVSTISPAILLSNLELQARDEELVTQSILPRPRL